MQTAIVIILLGVFIFWGHYLSGLFERKSIPDVLGLMVLGMLLGPVLHIIDPLSFGNMGSLFSNLVLIFILFESGTDLKISEIRSSFRESAGITTLNFLVTWIVTSVLCNVIFNLPWVSSLFIGATLGGTSSAVVIGLVKKISVKPKTATMLIIESAKVPVLVDAGGGTASDAAIAMELGCAGVLMNTAIAAARDPVRMAGAMKLAVEAGREAFLAGRMPRQLYAASPSSPTAGLIA